MVTTPNQQDGAPTGSSPQQQEQQPTSVVNSTQENHSLPTDSAPEVMPPLTHPAPLPNEPVQTCNGNIKRPPPRVVIMIHKVPVGAVVSWHALLTPNHEEIAKYQLYTYQESSLPPSTSLWKKLGDIDPLPLPMACTLTQFSAGCTYHFAVRAVDVHGRTGLFSESLSMYMEEDKIADELKMKNEEEKAEKEEAVKVKEEPVEEMEPAEEREVSAAQVNDVEDKSAVQVNEEQGLDSVQVKEAEKAVGPVKDQEKAIVQVKDQEKDVVQVKEQEKGKMQVKEQDKELVPVKEEKERSPCSC